MVHKRAVIMATYGTFLALLAIGLTGCGGSTSPTTPGETQTFTSTVANGHTHTVTIEKSNIQSPPMSGITETTSSNAGHTHSFAMTHAQLMTCNGGSMVMVMTGSSDVGGAHTHNFSVMKWF